MLQQLSPSYSFTKSRPKPPLLLPSISNGPAMYNIQSDLNKSSSLIFNKYSTRQPLKLDNVPGIGYYDPKPFKSHTSITFKQSCRSKERDLKIPGPGSYDILESTIKGGKIGRYNRQFPKYNNGLPGVGSYNLNRLGKPSTQKNTFAQEGASRRRQKQMPTPGPGEYQNLNSSFQKSLRISQSKRTWSYIDNKSTPGPGSYSLEVKTNKRKVHKTSKEPKMVFAKIKTEEPTQRSNLGEIGKKNTMEKKSGNKPGVSFNKGQRKFEFLDQFNQFIPQPVFRSPGPAQYEGKTIPKVKSVISFSKEKKETFKPKEGPGVGAYGELQSFGKQYTKKKPKTKSILFLDIKNWTSEQFL